MRGYEIYGAETEDEVTEQKSANETGKNTARKY